MKTLTQETLKVWQVILLVAGVAASVSIGIITTL